MSPKNSITHALIFAAGRGERMRPLTDHSPKPLLYVRGKRLIEYHLEKLAAAGVSDVVINTSYLAQQFAPALGNGSRWGLRLHFSYEGATPLETGGGMLQALPLLGNAPFIAVNGDILTDFNFSALPQTLPKLAHLIMVDNPPHNPSGDFSLVDGLLHDGISLKQTFAGIGVYRAELLGGQTAGRFPLAPILRRAMVRGDISGEHYRGDWTDVGSPTRLAELETILS